MEFLKAIDFIGQTMLDIIEVLDSAKLYGEASLWDITIIFMIIVNGIMFLKWLFGAKD